MLPLFFLATYIFATACCSTEIEANDQKVFFRKCCPRLQVLIKVNETNETTSEDFECVNSDHLRKEYNILDEPLYVSNTVTVKNGLPSECVLQILNTNSTVFQLNEEECYDKFVAELVNGTLRENISKTVILTCNHTNQELGDDKLKIYEIRKCCPSGQSYDPAYHECRTFNSSNNIDWLDQLKISFGDIFEIESNLFCNGEEYAVELQESKYHLSIEGDTLYALSIKGEKYGRSKSGKWCMDQEYGGTGLVAKVCTRNCQTFSAYCVRKCCPHGQHYKPRNCFSFASDCVPNEESHNVWFNISTYLNPIKELNNNIMDVMGLRIGLNCPHKRYALNTSLAQDKHHLTRDAHLQTPDILTNNYCVEVFDRQDCPENDVVANGVMCYIPPRPKNFLISFVVNTISSVCLALTLFVYCVLPELRNLHGRTLICHVSMMLLAYVCLARVQHSKVEDVRVCTVLGYCIYFGFVAAFVWLNVMCLDIWWTFGSIRTVKTLHKTGSECRRFIWYSLYAWSVTIVFTLAMFLLDYYPVDSVLDANMGIGICWFGSAQNSRSDWPHYIFFVIPMGIVTGINFILWLLTARHCAQVKSEVHRLQAGSVGDRAKRRFRIDRANFILTGKLWVVMGAGWICELLSTVVSKPFWLWNIVDLFNEMQGVFIFLILVVKPKVYYLIRKRLGLSRTSKETRLEKPDVQNNATSSSSRTSSTFLSRTVSSDERTNLRISLSNNKQC